MYSRKLKSVLSVLGCYEFWALAMGCKKPPPITLACNGERRRSLPGRSGLT